MSRPKGSKNKVHQDFENPIEEINIEDIISINDVSIIPTVPHLTFISHLKDLPGKNSIVKMVEYDWSMGLSVQQAEEKFFKENGYRPERMYAMVRWFIPIRSEE